MYFVPAGHARLAGPDTSIAVGPGGMVFVAAGEERRFEGVSEALREVVLVGPAEHCRRNP